MSITPAQSRAARGLVDWSQTDLGREANLSESTIRDFEKGRRVPSVNNLAAIERALQAKGVIFVEENGEGPGVRLRKGRRANDHPTPTGPATDAVETMDAAIEDYKKRRKERP